MTFKEIQRYLNGDCVVRNEKYEYKKSHNKLFCRMIGTFPWNSIYSIPNEDKEQEWELVGKK